MYKPQNQKVSQCVSMSSLIIIQQQHVTKSIENVFMLYFTMVMAVAPSNFTTLLFFTVLLKHVFPLTEVQSSLEKEAESLD